MITDGLKSSEALMTFLIIAFVLVAKMLGYELNADELYAIAGVGSGYAVSRGIAKVGSKAPVKGK